LRSELRRDLALELVKSPISDIDFGLTSGLIIRQINYERGISFSRIRKRQLCRKGRRYHDKQNHRKTRKDEDAYEE
jgi:hypothetical protein